VDGDHLFLHSFEMKYTTFSSLTLDLGPVISEQKLLEAFQVSIMLLISVPSVMKEACSKHGMYFQPGFQNEKTMEQTKSDSQSGTETQKLTCTHQHLK
jgi:hypothetical protein